MMKRILITGTNSYIGNAVAAYLETYRTSEHADGARYQVDKISLRDGSWETADFSGYDAILHVAGMAHADVSRVSEETKKLYYHINADLPAKVAKKAKAEGVGQFIHLSSVIVYGDSAGVGKEKMLTADTVPQPSSFYGDSKLQGEEKLSEVCSKDFKVAILRLPMVYGKGSKGNYPLLAKMAGRTPVFPNIQNKRSMIYIENLAEFIRLLTEKGCGGLFFPQNEEYVTTARMVRLIGAAKGKKVRLWSILNPFVWLASKLPGGIGALVNKAFGSLTIEQSLSGHDEYAYQKYTLEESIGRIHEN